MRIPIDSRLRGIAALAIAMALVPTALAQQRTTAQPTVRRVVRPTAASLTTAPAATIAPPSEVAVQVPPTAVMLRPGDSATTLRSLRVTREHTLSSLRAQPVVALQTAKIDVRPMLANPQALFNVAERLRAQPQLVQVTLDQTRLVEVENGVVVLSSLGYQPRLGACSDRARASQLSRLGVRCFTQMTPQTRAAAFANPRDPHFVADPRQRAIALRQAEDKAAQVRAQVTGDIAALRTMLADPAQRAAIEAEVGAADAARLASLDDSHLEAEVVNSGETRIEQVMYVPGRGGLDRTRFSKVLDFGSVQPPAPTPAPAFTDTLPPQEWEHTIDPRTYLTGFTLGREYEWRQRIETTIKWCVIGCKKTYYVELFAGFNYGFGLRFPIALGGTYQYQEKPTESASLTTNLQTINGGLDDYRATGLSESQVFDGKELVAQVGAYAGVAFKVPIFGSNSARADVGMDFTKDLPAPFTNGDFRAPMPGESMPPMEKVFTDVDLIGGRANFGVVGGQVFPALKAELHSDALHFTLHDKISGQDQQITANGQVLPLKVDAKKTSDFRIEDPVYNLGFLVTPGIDARLFLDIEVWSGHWDWPVWFPQLAIQLPQDGVQFACHAGTVCAHDYRIAKNGVNETQPTAEDLSPFITELGDWANDFEARWLQQCVDDICKTGIRLVRTNAFLLGKQAFAANPAMTFASTDPIFVNAEATATTLVHESQMRLTQQAGKGWAILAQAVWSKRCSDLPCLDKVALLAKQMVVAANLLQMAKPDASSLEVQGEINREYGAKFQAEIDASLARVAQQVAKQTPVLFQPIQMKH